MLDCEIALTRWALLCNLLLRLCGFVNNAKVSGLLPQAKVSSKKLLKSSFSICAALYLAKRSEAAFATQTIAGSAITRPARPAL